MIIGLSGYAQSGKDTVAKILVEQYGFTRVAFADKIRELLLEVNPIMYNGGRLSVFVDSFGWDVAKAQPEVRRLLQDLGVGARKLFGDTFWVDQVVGQLGHEWWGYKDNIVITDVRFTNEADAIKGRGGQIWRIKRPGIEAVNNHVSEHDLDWYKVDQILSNRGTVEELELLVQQRMDNIRANKVT